MKRVIIIEGTDNVGKDTIIQQLKNKYNNVSIYHCEKPKSKNTKEAAKEQDELFTNLASMTNFEILIHNRSWYGEYVYGVKYRQNNPDIVKDNIVNKYESILRNNFGDDDICFITLLSDNADFLVKNDDGLSISQAKKELIEDETKRFKEIFECSTIKNKHIIYVNDGENWRSKKDIFNEVVKYIEQ